MDWVRRLLFTPEQASTVSGEWDALYGYVMAITVFFTVLVVVLIFYFAVKYRRRDPLEIPRPNAGSLKLETMWTVAKALDLRIQCGDLISDPFRIRRRFSHPCDFRFQSFFVRRRRRETVHLCVRLDSFIE